ncbi:MAG: hypothetical protein LC663_02075, partial [Actinobacteria bacterium]|nr:hypothetical protein [Actinomycetota bacterium]
MDLRLAPPSLRATQTVSNCRTERDFQGDPGIPLVGLPDCNYDLGQFTKPVVSRSPVSPSVVYDQLRAAGVPVPDNIGVPSFVGLQETPQVHVQAIKLGGIGITVCPCEQWGDQAHNIRSRLLKSYDGTISPGSNVWDGFDWTLHSPDGDPSHRWCTQNADTTWTCKNPQAWHWQDPTSPSSRQIWSTDLPPVSDHAYKRMIAEIHNDAAGWDALTNLQAETDPVNPSDIKGNFTHEQYRTYGYDLVVPVGMSNDYMGYLVTYREWERGDHYRKALTGLGPHSEDFFATRLSRMAADLNGAAYPIVGPKDIVYSPEDAREYATAQAIGAAADAYLPAYEATLPADGGSAAIEQQPQNITRFAAASLQWAGGDTYTDTPDVRVERLVDGTWRPFADGHSEVEYRTTFPLPSEMPAWRAGQFVWHWQATFEAFGSDIRQTDASGNSWYATPAGTYRFVVDGTRRGLAGATSTYHLESSSFDVSPWKNITVESLHRDGSTVAFKVGPVGPTGELDYTDSYASPFPFISSARATLAGGQQFCLRCSFRPWADAGVVASATVTVTHSDGSTSSVAATLGPDGWWRAPLLSSDTASIEAGGIVDSFGQVNGVGSGTV